MTKLPRARTADLVVKEIDDELLVCDLQTNKVLCLNETARVVFNACDGETSFEDLRRQNEQLNDGVIQLALEKLSRENLLTRTVNSGMSRRTVLQKAALAAIALPIITAVVAPTAVHAASCAAAGTGCVSVSDCCPGLGCQNVAGLGVRCCTPPGGACTFPRPDLCCSGCCTAAGAPPGSQICC